MTEKTPIHPDVTLHSDGYKQAINTEVTNWFHDSCFRSLLRGPSCNGTPTSVKFEYSCNGRCDFSKVLESMSVCPELKNHNLSVSCMEIVKHIDDFQEESQPEQLNGISINKLGRELVFLKNKDYPNSDTTGYVEYDDLKFKEVKRANFSCTVC